MDLGLAFLLAWGWGSRSGFLDPFFFSRPSEVTARVWRWIATGVLWKHLLTTAVETALSLGIGAFLGIAFGFVLARIPVLAELFDPYIRIANSLPRVILAHVFLLWFGLGIWSKVALGVTVMFFVMFFNTYRGVREVDPVILDNARMLGASERPLIYHVLIPSALTWIFSSLHISVGLAIVAVVVGEYQAEGVFDTTGVFAGVTVLSLGVLLVNSIISRLERWLLRWKSPRARDASEGFA